MKNNLILISLISILFFACKSNTGTPLEKVDKALAEPFIATSGFSKVRLFTTDKLYSDSKRKQLMKMSIDYNTQFDQMGIFIIYDNHLKNEQVVKELTTIDLTDDKNDDGIYIGKKVLALTEYEISSKSDTIMYEIFDYVNSPNINCHTLSKFKLRKPKSYPYGIQHYEKNLIPEGEMIHLYSLKLREENNSQQLGYQAELVLVGYDSSKKDDLFDTLEYNKYTVLHRNYNYLTIPNSTDKMSRQTKEEIPDYIGFAFGENGK